MQATSAPTSDSSLPHTAAASPPLICTTRRPLSIDIDHPSTIMRMTSCRFPPREFFHIMRPFQAFNPVTCSQFDQELFAGTLHRLCWERSLCTTKQHRSLCPAAFHMPVLRTKRLLGARAPPLAHSQQSSRVLKFHSAARPRGPRPDIAPPLMSRVTAATSLKPTLPSS